MSDGEPAELTVQEVAARTGLRAHTLRYYEPGLIPLIHRDASSGHRRYNEDDSTLDERRRMLEAHGAVVRRQIDDLQTCLASIACKVASYTRLGATAPLVGPCSTEREEIK